MAGTPRISCNGVSALGQIRDKSVREIVIRQTELFQNMCA